MKHLRQVVAFLSVAALGSGLAGCSTAAAETEETAGQTQQDLSTDVCPAGVPATLSPGAGQTLKSTLNGVGVQIYMCNATATGFAWTFVAPQANLYNDEGKLVGTHFIGPTWQGNDGSSVGAAKVAAYAADPTAVPWLLLKASSHSSEAGRFDDVTYVQRLSTVGGNAPADGCDATALGHIAQIPYSAQYVFYREKAQGNVKQCGG